MAERSWYWRRQRNQSFGYWEDVRSGVRVGPIPLDESGRAAFVPADASESAISEEELAEALDAIIASSGPITRQWAQTAARRILRRLEGEAET